VASMYTALNVLLFFLACKAQQDGNEKPNVLPSVLFADDACLSDDSRDAGTGTSHCSFDLLQTSGLYSSSRNRPAKKFTGRTPTETSSTGYKSGLATGILVGGRISDPSLGLRVAPRTLLAGVQSLVAEVRSIGQATQEIQHLAQKYAETLNTGPAKDLIDTHKRLQNMFLAQHNASARCAAERDARLESSRQLEMVYKNWEAMRQECSNQENVLWQDSIACAWQLENITIEKIQACSGLPGLSSADANFDVMSKQCHSATQAYAEQSVICTHMQDAHRLKQIRCDALISSAETAGCVHASSITGLCEGYKQCISVAELSHGAVKDVYKDWLHNSKHEWPAVEAVRCFINALSNRTMVDTRQWILSEISRCEAFDQNSTYLETVQDPHMQLEISALGRSCPTLKASPCKAIRRAPRRPASPMSVSSAAEMAARAALVQDAADENAGAVGVSLMQGRLHDVTTSVPAKIYGFLLMAMTSTLAMPYATGLMVLTGMVLFLRCTAPIPAVKGEKDARAKRTLADVQGSSPDDSEEEEENDAVGRRLCPELFVPRGSTCTIAIPVTPTGGKAMSASFGITDKLGQPLFGVSLLRTSTKPEQDMKETFLEHLVLTAQDGAVLATCQLRLPRSGESKDKAQCHILQRDGRIFAWLKMDSSRESSQGSWLFRTAEKSAPESTAETLVFAVDEPKFGRIKLQGDFAERTLIIVDSSNQMLASIDRSSKQAFDTGGRSYYKAEVGNENCDTDLCLIASLVLVTDRLLAS